MAIDKNKLNTLLSEIDNLFDIIVSVNDKELKAWLKSNIFSPAIKEIRKLVDESRPQEFTQLEEVATANHL